MQILDYERKVLQKLMFYVGNIVFVREVVRCGGKVAYRVDEHPTFESVVLDETSTKKSLFSVRILRFNRNVLQKLKMQNLFVVITVKYTLFERARYRICTIHLRKHWNRAILSHFCARKLREFWKHNITRNSKTLLWPVNYDENIREKSSVANEFCLGVKSPAEAPCRMPCVSDCGGI